MTPYAYSIQSSYETLVFPTLDAMARHLIKQGCSAARIAMDPPRALRAHVADSIEAQDVDLTPYMEHAPVDEAAVRAELAKAVADSHAEYVKQWPHGRTGPRFSGDHALCENSPEELEHIAQRMIERRSWTWRDPLPVLDLPTIRADLQGRIAEQCGRSES